MSVDEVRYERVGAAAVLTIDRQHKRNAVDGPTAEAAQGRLRAVRRRRRRARADPHRRRRRRVLRRRRPQGDRRPSRRGSWIPAGRSGFTRLTPPKPTIAAIEGWCLAGGLELALWCDLRITAEGSKLGFPERRWGVPLIDGGTQRMPRIIGLGRALDLILTGRIIEHDEALAMGLLTEVVAPGTALARALQYAEMLASRSRRRRCSPTARRRSTASACRCTPASRSRRRPGSATFADAQAGAARFAGGAGRGGAGAGVG